MFAGTYKLIYISKEEMKKGNYQLTQRIQYLHNNKQVEVFKCFSKKRLIDFHKARNTNINVTN